MGVLIFDTILIFIVVYFYENDKTKWGSIFLLFILALFSADLAVDFATWQEMK